MVLYPYVWKLSTKVSLRMDFKKLMLKEREIIRKELQLADSSDSSVVGADNSTNVCSKAPKDKVSVNQCVDCVDQNTNKFSFSFPDKFEMNDFVVGSCQDICYVPDVISEEQEENLSRLIVHAGDVDVERWKQLRTRRLQCWGKFPPSSDRTTTENNIETEEFVPSWLDNIILELVEHNIFDSSTRPNNILINQYTPLEGILHHTDGPIYHDKVAIISLNSDCIMTFRHHLSSNEIGSHDGGRSTKDVFSVLLRRRSLLYFSKDVYSEYMHGIECMKEVQIVGGGGVLDYNGEELCECVNMVAANAAPGDEVSHLHVRIIKLCLIFDFKLVRFAEE